jgi:hypothetical protein
MGKKLGGSQSRFLVQKCAETNVHASAISEFFRGLYPGPPFETRRGMGRGWEGEVECLTTFLPVLPPLNKLPEELPSQTQAIKYSYKAFSNVNEFYSFIAQAAQ